MSNNNSKSFTQEFFGFLKTFGIIGLAIAFVIGLAASRLVTSLVQDIVNPTVGLFLPASLEKMSANVTTLFGGTSQFKYGDLIANIIDFVIVALIVFIAYKFLKRHKLIEDKTEAESK